MLLAIVRGTCTAIVAVSGVMGKTSMTMLAGSRMAKQIVSMEADLDKGTLRFWVDGKPHSSGHSSGVGGRLRWAVGTTGMYFKGAAVEIVPTPELQPWTPWVPPEPDSDEDY